MGIGCDYIISYAKCAAAPSATAMVGDQNAYAAGDMFIFGGDFLALVLANYGDFFEDRLRLMTGRQVWWSCEGGTGNKQTKKYNI